MNDITDRLRRWSIATDAAPASDLMDEAADLIESLRLLASVQSTSTQVAWELSRLTDAERQAVEAAIGWIESPSVEDEAMPEDYLPITATLRGLLERTAVRKTA